MRKDLHEGQKLELPTTVLMVTLLLKSVFGFPLSKGELQSPLAIRVTYRTWLSPIS